MKRLVLDTNVVLDLVYWHDAGVTELAAALGDGRATALTDSSCLAELRDVVARPEFSDPERNAAAQADAYSGACMAIPDGPIVGERLPQCRDPDDQKFLELARRGRADWLITRDKALLALARKKHGIADFRILTPQQAEHLLADHGA